MLLILDQSEASKSSYTHKYTQRQRIDILSGPALRAAPAKTILNDHIATNFHQLKMKHTGTKFFSHDNFNDHKPNNLSTILLLISVWLMPILSITLLSLFPLFFVMIPLLSVLATITAIFLFYTCSQEDTCPPYHWVTNEISWLLDCRWTGLTLLMRMMLIPNSIPTRYSLCLMLLLLKRGWKYPSCDDPAKMNTWIKTYTRHRNQEYDNYGKSRKWRNLLFLKLQKNNFASSVITKLKDKNTAKPNMSSTVCALSMYSRICMKMSSFLFVCSCAMPRILYSSW